MTTIRRLNRQYCQDCSEILQRMEMSFNDGVCDRCSALRLERVKHAPGKTFEGKPHPVPKGDSRRMYK